MGRDGSVFLRMARLYLWTPARVQVQARPSVQSMLQPRPTAGPWPLGLGRRTAGGGARLVYDRAMKVLLALLVVLLLILQYRLWFGDGSLQEVWRLREQALASQAEVQRLSQRNQALAAEVADLKSGMDAIEERARAELGMINTDETFYQFVLEQSTRARTAAPELLPTEPEQP